MRRAKLAPHGVKLLLEPINYFDMPGFYLNKAAQADELIDEAGVSNLYIQYDIYHAQRMCGALIETYMRLKHRIAHIQIADTPGRHEPGTGEINYANVFRALESAGYEGWIGCEYRPKTTTIEGLGWMRSQIDSLALTVGGSSDGAEAWTAQLEPKAFLTSLFHAAVNAADPAKVMRKFPARSRRRAAPSSSARAKARRRWRRRLSGFGPGR